MLGCLQALQFRVPSPFAITCHNREEIRDRGAWKLYFYRMPIKRKSMLSLLSVAGRWQHLFVPLTFLSKSGCRQKVI